MADEGNVNGTIPDGPLINDEVVGVEYVDPTPAPEPIDQPAPSKSKPAPAPDPAPEPVEEPPAS